MKETPLTAVHIALGAKMAPFAGYFMPIEYCGIKNEHLAVRQNAGVFDVSHMGEIWVTGPNALSLIQRVTSNDASLLVSGQAQYSCFPNGKGGIVDDLLVYCFDPERYMLVVNASNIDKDWDWLMHQNKVGAVLENASDATAQLAVQGPRAKSILQKLTSADLDAIPYYSFRVGTMAGIPEVIISATGYTGAGGFELYCKNEDAVALWDAVFDAGKEEGIIPIGLGARDTLRLEMGYCLYGHDIDDTTSPLEAGLGWITKFVPGKNFVDMPFLLNQKAEGVKKRLRGFRMIDRGIPRQGYEILNIAGEPIGSVTSGSISPVLDAGIGMGYIQSDASGLGNEIFIVIRNKQVKARIVKLPFI
ncbi:MAG TPA: glycine cleavage system aminomethyltransferase GcvT [Prolixibacteraceae bacterium]|nr:glycine cleavage system aminomethyltransferase GcvT [Prolixibacteraceae bacterium]